FMQKLNQNSYVESYGFIYDGVIPRKLGIYRVANDYIGSIYFGTESNRRSSWLGYSIPTGFYEPTGATLRAPRSNEVLTDDGYFEQYSNLCPSGQVELYQKTLYIPYGTESGTGRCYTYVEPADCYHSSMGGYDIDRFGNMCDLQVGYPTQCPSGTYLLTPYTSPSDDYMCEYRQSPYCPPGTIRKGGSCYYYTSPSSWYCYNSCSGYYSSCSCGSPSYGYCTCSYTYRDWWYARYENGTYVCPTYSNCVLNYQSGQYCYYTCTGTSSFSACPSGYWYDYSTGYCISYYGSACSGGYSYDSSRDICYYRVQAWCSYGTRKCCDPESPGGRYSGCYVTNTYVGPGTAYPSDQTGKIYCRNGLYFYRDRCYRYNDIACSRTYSESLVSSGNLVILGSEDSLGQWTGTCWRKTEDSCRGDAIIRKPHVVSSQITDNTCGRERQRVNSVSDLTSQNAISDFEQALLRYFRRYYFGTTSGDFKISPYPYTSSLVVLRGFFEEPNKFICPLDSSISCAPLSGNTYICTNSEKFCAMCTEGIPPKAESNQVFAGIYRIKEFPDRVYGLFRSKYNYLGAYDMTNAIPGSRLPKSSEVSQIKSFFKIDSFWTEESVSSETNFEKLDNVVVVMSVNNFGFVAECLFGDDMNMVCTADMVPCNGNTCPLGNYQCIPVAGVKYCSKYSWTCKNLADPRVWEGVGEEYDPDPETESPGEIDNEQGCLGQISIFSGTALRCRPQGLYTGPNDCCDDDLADEDEIPKDSFGGSPHAFLAMGVSMAITAVTQAGQLMYRLYDIYRAGGRATLSVSSKVDPILGKISAYKLDYGGKTVYISEGQGRMFQAIAGEGGVIDIKSEGAFGKALGKGIAGYFGSAEFAYDVFSAIVPMMINDPYGKAVASVALSALKMVLFPGTSPIGLAMAVASLVMTYFMMSCDAQDYQTVRLRRAGRCVKIGDFCIKKWPVVGCVQKGRRYCCFNSKIARIIHEQGRPQLSTFNYSHNWGGSRKPNCRGFTPEEFQALDFGKIDFSEYIEDIEREVKSKFQQIEQDIYKRMKETTKERLPSGGD
ncbi:MAG: conjugal transfer protein TraN, partial [Candidatus Jordarchaeaceae archaeon]